jgi:hypothetical protein
MNLIKHLFKIIGGIFVIFILLICIYYIYLSRPIAVGTVWYALEPYTSSHDIRDWQIVDIKIVTGKAVMDQFIDPTMDCGSGIEVPENLPISDNNIYWLVILRPRPATPLPKTTEISPTTPPLIPEPLIDSAYFLIDYKTNRIIARNLQCNEY